MKIIKDSIVFFTYQGLFSQRSTKLLLQEIIDLKKTAQDREIKGIYISIKNIEFDDASLQDFVEHLDKISKNILIPIAIGEYSKPLYIKLRELTKNSHVKLFKTTNIAKLFFHPKSFSKKLKVLLFDDGEEYEVEKQASLLAKYEHVIVYAKSLEELQEKLEKNGIDFAISQSKLNLDFENTKPTQNFSLSKNLVTNLPFFIDTAVDNLEMLTSLHAQKTAHSISPLKTDIKEQMISSVMKFKGDIEGSFVLIFPKPLALQAIEAMLGESLDSNDNEALSDGVGEFCNIITGSTKTLFLKKDIQVLFELPKTYLNMSSVSAAVGANSGIWIDMKLQDKPFYMFLTK